MEITQVTTRLVVTVEEAAALGDLAGLGNVISKALAPSNGNGHSPHVVVDVAPAPANRMLPEAGGKPLVRCPKCNTDLVYYKLASHVNNKACRAVQRRTAAAERARARAQGH